MKVAVTDLGHVGLVTTACVASSGPDVWGIGVSGRLGSDEHSLSVYGRVSW